MITSELEFISPEKAAKYLTFNTGNRNIRKGAVTTLSAAIARGEWKVTHQGIAFSDAGRLIDGQHRLSAVVMSGMTVQMMVSRGIPDESFMVLDQHIKRTYSDVLEAPRHVVDVAVFAANLVHGSKITSAQVSNWLSIVGDEADAIISVCASRAKYLSSVGMRMAAILSVMNGGSRDYVYPIYRSLVLGHVAELPPIGQNLIQQVVTGVAGGKLGRGGGRSTSYDAMMRGRTVFDESKRNLSRVQATDLSQTLEWAKSSLLRAAPEVVA